MFSSPAHGTRLSKSGTSTYSFVHGQSTKATDSRSNPDQPLKSTHSLPERVYNLSYAPTTARLLVSMAHRHVSVYSLPTLAAATDGQDTKAEQNRESALKFLTRSVAVMADGKGTSHHTIDT